MKPIIIVGGGITGCFTAYLLKKKYPAKEVLLIEQSDKIGGLLGSFRYDTDVHFDIGVHTFYETKNNEVDDFFKSLVPTDNDWNYLNEYERDLGGSFFEEQLNLSSPYIDLRAIDPSIKNQYIDDFINKASLPSINLNDCKTMATSRFGAKIANDIIRKCVEARQAAKWWDIHPFALTLQGLTRVSIFEQDQIEPLSKTVDSVGLAFPDQRNYPRKYLPKKRAYYPKEFGCDNLMKSVHYKLKEIGVQIHLNSSVRKVDLSKGDLSSISIVSQNDSTIETAVDSFFWTSSPFGLPKLFFPDLPIGKLDTPGKTKILNFLFDREIHVQGLYYIFFHDHPFIHRVSFPKNYSCSTWKNNDTPICLEILDYHELDDNEIIDKSLASLRQSGILNNNDIPTFKKLETLPSGFPRLTCQNMNSITQTYQRLHSKHINNVFALGILSEENLFFQFDILKRVSERIEELNLSD